MFFYQGLICPVCQRPFSEGEDIVSCPQCGLPHHRTCWQQEGHCHLESLHGTSKQWSRDKSSTKATANDVTDTSNNQNICKLCGAGNLEYAEFCSQCGAPLQDKAWQSTSSSPYQEYTPFRSPYQPHSEYSPEERLDDYLAKDLGAVVGSNTAYYIPQFRSLAQRRTARWNWAAFLFGPYWLLYRKSYLFGWLYFAVQTAYSLAFSMIFADAQGAQTMQEMQIAVNAVVENQSINWMLLPLFMISFALLGLRIFLGIQGNKLYFNECKRRIEKTRNQEGGTIHTELISIGGVSLTAAVIAYLIPMVFSYAWAMIQTLF